MNQNSNLQFTPGEPGTPIITGNPWDFLNNPQANYIAVYPKRGQQCSESKILHRPDQNTPSSAAEILLGNKNMRDGCVILYTTYTPCTTRCFSNSRYWSILQPLRNLVNRLDQNIGKYLVFSRVFHRDAAEDNRIVIRNRMRQVADTGFQIKKCDGEGYQIACQPCRDPNYCIN